MATNLHESFQPVRVLELSPREVSREAFSLITRLDTRLAQIPITDREYLEVPQRFRNLVPGLSSCFKFTISKPERNIQIRVTDLVTHDLPGLRGTIPVPYPSKTRDVLIRNFYPDDMYYDDTRLLLRSAYRNEVERHDNTWVESRVVGFREGRILPARVLISDENGTRKNTLLTVLEAHSIVTNIG